MSQNRLPPAYQEYAASMLSNLAFRTMSLQDRGLLYTLRLECWTNVKLPKDPAELAKILAKPLPEITESLIAVMPFFESLGDSIISQELEDYRANLAHIRKRKSEGGKRSASIANSKRKTSPNIGNSSISSSDLQVSRRVTCESLVQSSSVQLNQTQSLGNGDISLDAEWIRGYVSGSE